MKSTSMKDCFLPEEGKAAENLLFEENGKAAITQISVTQGLFHLTFSMRFFERYRSTMLWTIPDCTTSAFIKHLNSQF